MTEQADTWSLDSLLALLSRDSQAERLDRLRRLGLLDEQNRVTAAIRSWGSVLSHTAVEDDDEPADSSPEHPAR